MKISNDIKAKVFAQYLDCEYKTDVPIIGHHDYKGLLTIEVINAWDRQCILDIKRTFQLLLKPLSQISDEDELTLCDLIGTFDATYFIRSLIEKTVYSINAITAFQAFQFLQSKGYDLPNWYLGGKTLHECNLAIYE